MKSKKLLSLLLAFAMILAFAVPAFAEGTEEDTTGTERAIGVTTEVKSFAVDVTISGWDTTSGAYGNKIIFNPYQMEVLDSQGETVTDTLISPAVFITNETPVDLNVFAKLKATKGAAVTSGENQRAASTIIFKDTPLETTDKGKSLFGFWEIMIASDNETEPKWTTVTQYKQYKTDVAGSDTAKKEAAEKALAATVILSTTEQKPTTPVITLPAKGLEDDANYAAFHFCGEAVKNPIKSSNGTDKSDPWLGTDDFTAALTLTFEAA